MNVHCRAYPDEKGIETIMPQSPYLSGIPRLIAEPIPMKRELKPI